MKCLRGLVVLVSALVFIFVSDIYAAKEVCIVNVNDFHSMIYHNKTSYVPGMVFFMNAILFEMKKHGRENVILVSGGDNYQGSIVSFITQGGPVNDMFRELEVAFSAVGNHEFDWGQQLFRKWQKDGNFVYLAANIVNEETGKAPAWIEPYKIVKKNGVKLAFIGLSTLETATKTNAKNFKGLKIIEPWISAQFWIDYLKSL
jgi:2',3'-cyclic-nucleotide 2'-phosphodiesterase (5'-nucleotidase family)